MLSKYGLGISDRNLEIITERVRHYAKLQKGVRDLAESNLNRLTQYCDLAIWKR